MWVWSSKSGCGIAKRVCIVAKSGCGVAKSVCMVAKSGCGVVKEKVWRG